jgi:hypothetical protein
LPSWFFCRKVATFYIVDCFVDFRIFSFCELFSEVIFCEFLQNSSEVHANAAETLSAITRIPQSALATKLASPMFVGKLFNHVLEDPESKSTLVHSLSVCISLLDLKRSATIAASGASRGQHVTEPVPTANPDTVEGMLHRLGIYLSRCLPSTRCLLLI